MILAAGLGTRLKPFTDHHPKALALVKGKTLLERNIRYLQSFGIVDVVVNVHHFAEQIEALLYEHRGFGSNVMISDERDAVLETGGGLMKAAHFFGQEPILVMNVDILTNLDLNKMIAFYQTNAAMAVLAVTDRMSSRQLLFDKSKQLCSWRNVQSGEEKIVKANVDCRAYAFSGIHIVHNSWVDSVRLSGKFSIIDAYLQLAENQKILAFDHSGDVLIDVGKPESLMHAEQLFAS